MPTNDATQPVSWGQTLQQAMAEYSNAFTGYVPSIVGAVLLLFGGWICAKLARYLTARFITSIHQIGERFAERRGISQAYISRNAPQVLGNVVFWLIFLLFLVSAAKILQLEVFSRWLYQLIAYLPTLITGVLIMACGIIFGNMVRDLTMAALPASTVVDRRIIGRSGQIVVIVTAIIIGADQIGINVNFLIIMSAVATGVLLGGLVLAFGLGAQSHVRDLIASRRLTGLFHVGQRIKVLDYQGRILSIQPLSIILETENGKLCLPPRLFADEAVLVLEEE